MLLSVVGTQCVGKSTFIKDFIEKYPKFQTPILDYRKIIIEQNLQINRNGNYRSQKILFDFILNQSIECSLDPNNFYILDRSIIDAYAYSVWLHLNTDISRGFTLYNMSDMLELLLKNVSLYNKIIYIPLNKNNHVKIVDDKFRDTDEKYREDIDNCFKNILNSITTETQLIEIFGSQTERINMISEHFLSE